MDYDLRYMRRAIQLAKSSPADTHPNPNVGAVIVAGDRIIGEGYHRRCGQPHAEVNAVASVAPADRPLLADATIYVTLEPCSHYGKTPPCARLIIDSGIPRVVIACGDPFDKVRGRGVAMLRDAGVEVVEGVLEDEARRLNPKFFTAHTFQRPFVTLKWAQSADGFMDALRDPSEPAFRFSTPLDAALVHRERALHDALLTTASTLLSDNPRLDVRLWDGPNPAVAVIDRHGVIDETAASRLNLFSRPDRRIIMLTPRPLHLPGVENIEISHDTTIGEILTHLYRAGITSIMTECGPRMLQSLIDANLYDAVRVYTSPHSLASRGVSPAPTIPF
ncbi:MAG: bifunctional diaminohydroxyphosphoribosylaminopyrimidine deaminase/5-amino-6-(5-phosphoribosylamino)uracil reductase RibD [Muribaculaceae bacterium]|nr:bifunctional diaminohydroxyphosphoribosylaminopyrimidine deaminase/5-amino-6-(5-phosphoribosylamino)uracil reductase RibD [Muribaculaceae bacterium]